MTTEQGNFIDGRWASGGRASPSVNPSDTTDIVGYFAEATPSQVTEAIAAARAGATAWGTSPLETRYRALMAIGDELCRAQSGTGRTAVA